MSAQIEQLIKQLGDNTRQSQRAVSQLIRIGEPALEPLLEELERTTDETVQKAALLILNRIGDERAVPVLKYLLYKTAKQYPPYFQTPTPAMILAKLGAFEPLREALQSPDPFLRRMAAEAIGMYGQLRDINLLIPLLEDPDDTVRVMAATVLGRFDSPDLADLWCHDEFLLDRMTVRAAVNVLLKHDKDCLYDTIYRILPGSNADWRQNLLIMLRNQNDSHSINFRLFLLSSDLEGKVRARAALELGQPYITPSAGIEKALILALDDPYYDVRKYAAGSLGKCHYSKSFDSLLRIALHDENAHVQRAAIDSLGYLGDRRASEHLIPLLQDKNLEIRRSSSSTLRRLKHKQAVQPLLRSVKEHADWSMNYDLTVLAGPGIVEPMIDLLRSEDAQHVILAARILSYFRDDRCIQPLIGCLDHEDETVREAVARTLSATQHPDAVNALAEMIEDDSTSVMSSAVKVLHLLEDRDRAIRLCVRALERTRKWWELETVIFTLGKIGGDEVIPILMKLLQDRNNSHRFRVEEVLGHIGDERVIEHFIELIRTRQSVETVKGTIQALGQLHAKEAVPLLIDVMREAYDNDLGYSYALIRAIEALGKIGDQRAIDPIIETLDSERSEVKAVAAYALGKLGGKQASRAVVSLLYHNTPEVRQAAVSALRSIGDVDAVEGLISCLHDDNPITRAMATEALARIGDSQATSALIQALHDNSNRVRKATARDLVKIGLDALPALLQVDVDDNHDVRANRKLVWILGELGDPQATEKLITVAENISDLQTRSRAIEALGKIGDPRSLDVIMHASADASSYIRAPAATALAQFRQPQVIEQLNSLVYDDNENVRRAAKRSLELLDFVSDET